MSAPQHPQEAARLERLQSYAILDTPRDRRFDRLVFMAAQIAKVPIAKINFIDSDRQWSKAYVGTAVTELDRDVAICSHTILQREILIVEDTRDDSRFAGLPTVTGTPFIRFYAGVPLFSEEGLPLGTLCVIDRQPRRLTTEQIRGLNALASEIEELLYPAEFRLLAAE